MWSCRCDFEKNILWNGLAQPVSDDNPAIDSARAVHQRSAVAVQAAASPGHTRFVIPDIPTSMPASVCAPYTLNLQPLTLPRADRGEKSGLGIKILRGGEKRRFHTISESCLFYRFSEGCPFHVTYPEYSERHYSTFLRCFSDSCGVIKAPVPAA